MKSNILLKYENTWVALSKDHKKVLASDKDVKKLHEKVKEKKLDNKVTLLWIPSFTAALAPYASV